MGSLCFLGLEKAEDVTRDSFLRPFLVHSRMPGSGKQSSFRCPSQEKRNAPIKKKEEGVLANILGSLDSPTALQAVMGLSIPARNLLF